MPESIMKQYYEALDDNKLKGRACTKCGTVTFPPTTACCKCGSSEQEWMELSGKGTLLFLSHGIAPPPNPRFVDIAPYAYGHIRLEEGVFVQAIVTGVEIDPDSLQLIFEKGPVPVEPDIQTIKDLSVLAFRPV